MRWVIKKIDWTGFLILSFIFIGCDSSGLDGNLIEGKSSAGVRNTEIQVSNHPPTGNLFFFRGQLLSYSQLTAVGAFGITGTIYKISYTTVDPQGRLIEASGVVGVPPISPAFGLISVQHGTIIHHEDAPSELGDSLFEGTAVLPIGFILIMADYLGFGESTQFLHPYHHADTLGTSTVDAIRAGKILLQILRVSYRDRLFLMGYSEGGFSTLALQREIELNHPGEFNLAASIAGSGAYDLLSTSSFLLSQPVQAVPSFQLFSIFAINETYQLGRPASDFLNEPYASIAPPLFDGTFSRSEIDAKLTPITEELFNAQFLSDMNEDGETQFKGILVENSLIDWAPQVPTRLWHGENDFVVPFQNSVTALEAFRQNGSGDVELVPCEFGAKDHSDCAVPYFIFSLGFFLTFF